MPHSPGTVTLITNNFCYVFSTTQKNMSSQTNHSSFTSKHKYNNNDNYHNYEEHNCQYGPYYTAELARTFLQKEMCLAKLIY